MAKNKRRVIGPKETAMPVSAENAETTCPAIPAYQGLINPDGKLVKRLGSPILGVLTSILVVTSLNMLAGKDLFALPTDGSIYSVSLIIGAVGAGVIYFALHLDKKTSFKPFIIIGSIIVCLMVLQIISKTAFNYDLTLPNIGNSIFGAQNLADARVRQEHEKQIAKFRIMEVMVKLEGLDLGEHEVVRVIGNPYIKEENNPAKEPYVKAYKAEDGNLFNGTLIEIPYRNLKLVSSEGLFYKPEFSDDLKETSLVNGPGYKIYQPGAYTFNMKAGETTDHWIMFPSGRRNKYSISSKERQFIYIFKDGRTFNEWEITKLPKTTRVKLKLKSLVNQKITMLVK